MGMTRGKKWLRPALAGVAVLLVAGGVVAVSTNHDTGPRGVASGPSATGTPRPTGSPVAAPRPTGTKPVAARSSTATSGISPEVAELMRLKHWTRAHAESFLSEQVRSSERADTLATSLRISPDNFAIDPDTGGLIGYYTTQTQRTAMTRAGARAVHVTYSAETLEAQNDALAARLPSGIGLHWGAADVKGQQVQVGGTAAFFSSPQWRRAKAACTVPVKTVVETDAQAPTTS